MLETKRRDISVAWLLVLAGIAGCHSSRPPLCPSGLADGVIPPSCTVAAPSLVIPKVDEQVAALSAADAPAPRDYCLLTAAECQCRAAAFSPAANRRTIDVLIASDATTDDHGHCDAQAMLQRDLAAVQVEELRNHSAAEAMDEYFALLDIEQEAIGLEQGLQETKLMIDYVASVKSRGIVLAIDEFLPARRRLELLERRAQIDFLRKRTNDRLKLYLGWDLAAKNCIWPSTDLDVAYRTIDANEACATGLAHRHDLVQLQLLLSRLCSDTLPLARAVLAQTDGSPMIMPSKLRDLKSDRDLYLRKEQLEHLFAQRQRTATVEIAAAVNAVDAQLQRLSPALKKMQNWQDRAAELKRQEAAGKATTLDAGLARLDGIEARTEFLREVVFWKRSLTRLAAVQGCLASECQCAHSEASVADNSGQAKR